MCVCHLQVAVVEAGCQQTSSDHHHHHPRSLHHHPPVSLACLRQLHTDESPGRGHRLACPPSFRDRSAVSLATSTVTPPLCRRSNNRYCRSPAVRVRRTTGGIGMTRATVERCLGTAVRGRPRAAAPQGLWNRREVDGVRRMSATEDGCTLSATGDQADDQPLNGTRATPPNNWTRGQLLLMRKLIMSR